MRSGSRGAFVSEPFGSIYADCYDALYQEKDYEAECDLIERLLRTYGDGNISSILDLGCGTGNHALPLSARGFEIIGVDRSASMLAQARKKAAQPSLTARDAFYQADIQSVDLGRQFDAALLMFAVLGYQLENAAVMAALRTARRHLRSGGLLLFDVWYGPAVLFQRPSERVNIIPTSHGKILRVSSSTLATNQHVCTVRYHVWKFAAERLLSESEEEHMVRYFFPLELNLFLESTRFAPVRLGAFPEFDRDPDEHTWNVLCVARAV
jgi:SAM-dependent methyltransferase